MEAKDMDDAIFEKFDFSSYNETKSKIEKGNESPTQPKLSSLNSIIYSTKTSRDKFYFYKYRKNYYPKRMHCLNEGSIAGILSD